MEDKKLIKILFRDLKIDMKVVDSDGDAGRVIDYSDIHNVIVNFGRNGQGLYCLNDCDYHNNENIFYNDNSEVFDLFRNQVFCRRDDNQHHAKMLWDSMKYLVPNEIRSSFETEWNHYMMGEFKPAMFDSDIEKIKKYFVC